MFDIKFEFEGKELQAHLDDNRQTWFVAKNICNILDISNARQAVKSLDDDEKLTYIVHTSGQRRTLWFVNESGLYHLIFQSRKEEAKKFRKWVTSEVLPSIRASGSYIGKLSDEDKIDFIRRILPKTSYNQVSEKTGYRKIIAVLPHFRSCKIAKANYSNHPELFEQNALI